MVAGKHMIQEEGIETSEDDMSAFRSILYDLQLDALIVGV